jgi:hypothetical protein
MPQKQPEQSFPLILAHWCSDESRAKAETCFMLDDQQTLSESTRSCSIVMPAGDEARVHQLLADGAARVLIGDAALLDGTLIRRLAEQYGSERIGVAVLARKHNVTWTLDMVSNADFRCLTPSYGKRGWELMLSQGGGTGTDAEWWLGEMLACGVSAALIQVDMQDDDLNICAGLLESHANKLWFAPWQQPDIDLEPWVRYGQVRQLLLPEPNNRDAAEMARIFAAAESEEERHAAVVADVGEKEKAAA